MRRIIIVLGVATLMAATMAIMAAMALAQAQPVTILNEHIPFSTSPEEPAVNECTGESFPMEGMIHWVIHQTTTEDGGFHHTESIHVQGRGVSASGAKYVVVEGSHTVINGELGTEPGELTEQTRTVTVNAKTLRQGEAGTQEDFTVRAIFHLTQNANGEWTAEVDNIEVECR